MNNLKREITKEEHERMSKLSYGELNREIENRLSDSIRYGYGYYGCRLATENDKYYLIITTGSTCD